jgi:predicted small secreted protein
VTRTTRRLALVLVAIVAILAPACDGTSGIGMGIPAGGARWGSGSGGGTGPGVIVGGGPVYR